MRTPLFGLLLLATLAGCGARIVPEGREGRPAAIRPAPPTVKAPPIVQAAPVTAAPGTTNALGTGLVPGPQLSSFNLDTATLTRGLQAFRISCPALLRRTDQSGLTQAGDWQQACAAASGANPRAFFEDQFDVVQVGTGAAHATGYFVPEIEGSREKREGYTVPVYSRPRDLVEVDLGQFSESLKGKRIRGKITGNSFVPYADRAEIEEGALGGRGLEIAWVKDAVEFFFLQVQGSGLLRLPDGKQMSIGYDGQNGRDYTGIGKLMRDRNLLAPGQANMQGIVDWLRANPDQGRAIMRENRSWIFFRELPGNAVGALGTEVVGKATVAADPLFVPLGAPIILSVDRPEANGLWVAQDTGGAIKGANRFDTFWGSGPQARATAGGMSARGSAFILLPKAAAARLMANGAQTPQP
jgi:membrane-bound lytic murein transglycosylase A